MYYLDEMKPHAGVSEQDIIDEAMDVIEAQEASCMHKMNQPTGVSEQIQTNLHHYREVLREHYERAIHLRERGVSRMVKKILEIIPDFNPTDLYSESDSDSDSDSEIHRYGASPSDRYIHGYGASPSDRYSEIHGYGASPADRYRRYVPLHLRKDSDSEIHGYGASPSDHYRRYVPLHLRKDSDSEIHGYGASPSDHYRRYVPLHLRKEGLGLRMKEDLKIEQRNLEEMKVIMLENLHPTDADFLNSRVEAVQTEWCVGTKNISDFDHIAQSIKNLLSIRPPYAVTFPSIHIMATWLYNKSGDFPAPETADAVFHHLQVMSDQFESEGIDPETNKDLELYIHGERVGRRDLPNKTVLSVSERAGERAGERVSY